MTHLDLGNPSLVASPPFYHRGGKRALDLGLALLLLPFVALVVTVIFAISGQNLRSFLFTHPRVGRHGQTFQCWKIRTMVPDATPLLLMHLSQNPDAAAEWRRTHKLRDDPRITRFGRFLRRSSLDELPQIWNVLRGEMSLVGPRPITHEELHHYAADPQTYLDLRPGITGHWQIYGRGNGCYIQRLQMDQFYATRISLWRDLLLIVATAMVLFWPTGR